MKFDRWSPTMKKTFAFRVFKRHHDELNSHYWCHHAAFRAAFSKTVGKSPTDLAKTVFPVPFANRFQGLTLQEWETGNKNQDNWVRLASVIAIAGYLEVFIRVAL